MGPEIKKYLNIYQYLQDVYQFRKTHESTFSYDTWAKELSASDKSYVRLIILGKRPLNATMTSAFARNLKLHGDELDYFMLLVQYTQSKTQIQKNVFGKKLISLLRSELDQIEIQAHYDFLSNPILPRLQILLSFSDMNTSLKNLGFILNITEEEVSDALEKLVQLNLITPKENGYKPIKKSFKVPDDYGALGLQAFYKNNLEEATAVIFLPKDQRRFKSLLVPLSESEFFELTENIQNFSSDQLVKFNADEFAGRRLYQVHLNVIPVSEKAADGPG